MKTYEVKIFVLGCDPVLTMDSVLVEANCKDEAEQMVHDRYYPKGYGVYDSEEIVE